MTFSCKIIERSNKVFFVGAFAFWLEQIPQIDTAAPIGTSFREASEPIDIQPELFADPLRKIER